MSWSLMTRSECIVSLSACACACTHAATMRSAVFVHQLCGVASPDQTQCKLVVWECQYTGLRIKKGVLEVV